MQDTFDRRMFLSTTVLLEQNGLLIRSVAPQRFATVVGTSEGGREVVNPAVFPLPFLPKQQWAGLCIHTISSHADVILGRVAKRLRSCLTRAYVLEDLRN